MPNSLAATESAPKPDTAVQARVQYALAGLHEAAAKALHAGATNEEIARAAFAHDLQLVELVAAIGR